MTSLKEKELPLEAVLHPLRLHAEEVMLPTAEPLIALARAAPRASEASRGRTNLIPQHHDRPIALPPRCRGITLSTHTGRGTTWSPSSARRNSARSATRSRPPSGPGPRSSASTGTSSSRTGPSVARTARPQKTWKAWALSTAPLRRGRIWSCHI
jgi:hypothetical protein